MSFIDTIGETIFEGGRDALRSIAELAVSRTSEIDSGVASMDVATEAIGLETFVAIEATVAPEATDTSIQLQTKPAVDLDATTIPSNVADLGAFRRRRDAEMRVQQAHAAPVAQSTPEPANVPASVSVASLNILDPIAQARLNEAQKRIDDHFTRAA